MATIVEPAPYRQSRFFLDRSELMGPLFLAPAILYIVLLVALPFASHDLLQRQRLQHLQSQLYLRRPAEFLGRDRRRYLSPGADQHVHLHDRLADHRRCSSARSRRCC